MIHQSSEQQALSSFVPASEHGHRTLRARLWDLEAGRLQLMEDCCELIELLAVSGRGLKAATRRACFHAARAVEPGIIGYVLGKLMPDFLEALEPIFLEATRAASVQGKDQASVFRHALEAELDRVADALLGVTDAGIPGARFAVRRAYKTIRHEAYQPVRDSVPQLAELLEQHLLRCC